MYSSNYSPSYGYSRQQGDSIDAFLGQGTPTSYYSYSAYPQQQMAAAAVAAPPEYGSPGSFSGRKPMAPPGGFSSISLGDGSNYSPYLRYGAYQGNSNILGGYGAQAPQPAMYNSPVGGYGNADLTSQLNLPSNNALRRPPSAGRRAISQPTAADAGYGGGYGAASSAAAYGGSAGYHGGSYPAPAAYSSAASNGYSQATSQQGYGAPASSYGAANGYGASSYASYGSNGAGNGYGAGGGYSGAAGGYGSPSAGAGGYSAGGGSYDMYSNGSPKAAYHSPQRAQYSPSAPAVFVPGQKGQFGGKVIVQPPGGRTTLNIFG